MTEFRDGRLTRVATWVGRLSVRTRITVTFAVLSALALAVAGALVYALESARIDGNVNESIDQEIAELEAFQAAAVDPDTAEPVRRADQLLELFLARNVPEAGELLVGYDAGEATFRTPSELGAEILDDPEYRLLIAPLIEQGGSRVLDSAAFGEVWVTVVPVRNNVSSGALVVINFLDAKRAALDETMRTYTVVAALLLLVLTIVVALQSGRMLAPLRVLREAASDISTSDLSRRIPEQGHDDIAALTRTFNLMLGRLEGGFLRQREFLDDAGHELRTPLTVLRGHLELLEVTKPDDVAETRALLLDETDRMTRLVDDLIVLAKSGRPDFLVLAPTAVDALLEAVRAKATAFGERDWVLGPDLPITAILDEQRVTQALLQLAANAAKHTTAGARIAFAAEAVDTDLLLSVSDDGRGVPAADRERVFERFGRSVVPRGDDGFGLGLSIVRAIAEAHQGSAYVEEAVPQGARFVIRLPLVRLAESEDSTEETVWLGS